MAKQKIFRSINVQLEKAGLSCFMMHMKTFTKKSHTVSATSKYEMKKMTEQELAKGRILGNEWYAGGRYHVSVKIVSFESVAY